MIVFPVALVRDDGTFRVFANEAAFVGPGNVQHPAEAWRFWSAEDWAAMCPGWAPLPLIDRPPSAPGKRAERRPETDWTIGAAGVEVAYRLVDFTAEELAAQVSAAADAAVERINREAGEQRARHITVTTGQEGTYTAKQAEAERYAGGGAAPFPYLEAEAAATGSTVDAVAALVLATAQAWTALNAGIEGARRGALVAVERAVAAGDAAAVAAVFPVAWPGAA